MLHFLLIPKRNVGRCFFILIAFLLFAISFCYSEDAQETYFLTQEYKRISGNGKFLTGKIELSIVILNKDKNKLTVHIYKKVDPFGEYLNFTIEAKRQIGNIYSFTGKDNWKNEVEGYLEVNSEGLEFGIDCTRYDEYGIIFGILYGDRYFLRKE